MKIEELRIITRGRIGEAIGYGSLCWEPKPTGVFDPVEASKAVDHAMKPIDALLDVADAARYAIENCESEYQHTELIEALKNLEAVR